MTAKPQISGHPRRYWAFFCAAAAMTLMILAGFSAPCPGTAAAGKLLETIGSDDALLVTAPDGTVVFSRHADKKLSPASTLKLLTSLVALHNLGPGYHFPTDFFIDTDHNLKIKGYGDPLLLSETIDRICRMLAGELAQVNDIIVDDHYFSQSVIIPGRAASRQPFDAPNGALCANFNTIKFKKDRTGRYVSAETQTPLVAFARKKLRASGMAAGRIVFSHQGSDNVLYAGHLFRYFLARYGIQCRGTVKTGRVSSSDSLLRRVTASADLETLVRQLLKFSNNFMANQLLLAVGAHVYGPPATLEKGIRVARQYAASALELTDFDLVEGSGISHRNRISAQGMIRILAAFEPYRHLMRRRGREYYKTGTLTGVRTRAGYIDSRRGGRYRFVVMMNTKGKSAEKVTRQLLKKLP